MARGAKSVTSLIGAIDEVMARPGRYLRTHPAVQASVVGLAVVAGIAALAMPVRDSVGTANIVLGMGIVAGSIGAWAGIVPGAITGVGAGIAFALLHSIPHGLPRVEDEQDIVTTMLLVAWGLFAGWLHDRRQKLARSVSASHDDLGRLHRVAEVAARPSSTIADVIDSVTDEISAEMHLQHCRRVDRPLGDRRELRHNGLIDGMAADASADEIGDAVAAGIGIDLGDGTHLALLGHHGTELTRRQLRVGVMLADYAVAFMESHEQAPHITTDRAR